MDFERIHHDQDLYFRNESDTQDAWYEKELGDEDVQVGCDPITKRGTYRYVWHREKSNINVEKHDFSFYLACWAYTDKYRVNDGQSIRGTTARVRTDEGNAGSICGLDISTVYDYEGSEDIFPDRVVLFVRQETLDHGRTRIVSCYVPDDMYYLDTYSKFWIDSVSKKNVDGGFTDVDDIFRRLDELEKYKKSRLMRDQVLEDRRLEFVESLTRNRKTFLKFVAEKRPPKV